MSLLCEICHKRKATHFQTTQPGGPRRDYPNDWKFVCVKCGDETVDYSVGIDEFFRSPEEQADWLFHLSGKNWINMIEFREMLKRWVKAGGRRPLASR